MVVWLAVIPVIAAVASLGIDLGFNLYNSVKNEEYMSDMAGAFNEAVDMTLGDVSRLLEEISGAMVDLVQSIKDAALAIMQYMDVWNVILLSATVICLIVGLMSLYLSASANKKIRGRR